MIKSVSPIKLKQNVLYQQKPKYSYARDLINSSGLFTKEDYKCYEQIKHKIKSFSIDAIKKELSKSLDNINQFIQSSIKDTKLVSDLLIYNNSETLSSKFIRKLKSFRLYQYVLTNAKSNESGNKLRLYPSDVEYILDNSNNKNLPISTKEPLFVHPIEVAAYVTGSSGINGPRNSIKLHKNSKNRTFSSLFNEQERILQNIITIIQEKGTAKNFVYTNSDIKRLNTLIIKYHKLNSILKHNGINVSNIETLLYRPILPERIKVGDKLSNLDIVIDKTKVYDLEEKRSVPAIVTFANTNSGFRLKMYRYDEDLFNKIEKMHKQYNWYKNKGMYRELNNLNRNCYKIIQDSEIAEVFFQEKSAQEMKDILLENNLITEDMANKHINPDRKYIFVRNLKNYNRDKYYNVSLPLIKDLKLIIDENQMENTFINAFAYNNVKHSPAALYIRAGCEPISHTKEEIRNILNQEDKGYDKPILFVYHPKI